MKILLLSQYFWPESFRINELIDGLSEINCEVTVITGQPNYPEGAIFKGYKIFSFKNELHNGYQIIRVPMIPRGKVSGIQLAINYISFVCSASIFAPWMLRNEKFDAIFVYAPSPILQVIPAIILKKLRKVPLITWVGDLWPQSLSSTGFITNQLLLKQIERLVSFIYKNNNLILVQSRPFIEPVKKISGNVPVEYFPNPGERIFDKKYNINYNPTIYKLRDGFNVVFAGNLGSVQSLEMIVEAAQILRNEKQITIYLFGSGSMVQTIMEQINQMKLTNIILPGRYSPNEMPNIFRQADVLLVSLVRDFTMDMTVPAKIQSYMACGKPIIAALDGEGAKIVLEAGAGVASPAEDAMSLAANIIYLKDLTKEQLNKMGQDGYKYYQRNFELQKLCKIFVERVKVLKYS